MRDQEQVSCLFRKIRLPVQGAGPMEGDFQLGLWVVSPKLNSLSCDGKSVHLEPKVMQVLLCLADAGCVVSKERLMHAVWPDTFVTDDVLVRSISELRKAFADDAKNPQFIQTIPRAAIAFLYQSPDRWQRER